MKAEVTILSVSKYDFEGRRGASVVLFGDLEADDNNRGIVTTNCDIDFEEFGNVTSFPAKYKADVGFTSGKKKSGKDVAMMKLSNIELLHGLRLTALKA